jgi:hypothetical protein
MRLADAVKGYDARASREAADEAIEEAHGGADPAWRGVALHAVEVIARHRPTLTTDDVWYVLDLHDVEHPDEPRALGAIMLLAARQGLIEPTNERRASRRIVHHAFPCRVWRSLILGRPPR